MISIKTSAIFVIICSMLYSPVLSYAVVKIGSGSTNADTSSSPGAGNQISRVTAFVKEMKNNVLVLDDNRRFDLTGVEVINKKSGGRTGARTVVEMVFINNILKQVVIH
jgi:hypothetical protein